MRFMVEVDDVISAVPEQGLKVPDTREPLKALDEHNINFVESRRKLNHMEEEISKNVTRTSLAWINEDKFIVKELAIQRVALIPHHNIEAGIDINICIMVAPKNHDSEELEFKKTLHALSFEQRCGIMVRHICLSLEPFRAQ